jgi:hypothetical protein
MRSVLYWFISTTVAVLCMNAVATPNTDPDMQSSMDAISGYPAPDPIRAIMLGVGILAMAYTYQRAWINLRKRS